MKSIVSQALSVFIAMILAASMIPTVAFGLTEETGSDTVEDVVDLETSLPPSFDESVEEGTSDIQQNDRSEDDEVPEVVPAPDEATELLETDDPTESFSTLEEKSAPIDEVTAFVTRLYTCVLGREPDAGGLKAHVESLRAGNNGAAIAWSFFGSPEFANRPLSNEERIRIAYLAMFDRAPDAGGMANFTSKLASGMSMRSVISDFSKSPEYRSLCAKWGVAAGVLEVAEPRDRNKNVTDFVQRLYSKVLGRSADVSGLNAHTSAILSSDNAASTAWSFFGSPEFANRPLSNEERIRIAYLAMFDREPDPIGKANFMGKLASGMSMRSVISDFSRSAEYRSVCARWGIAPGALYVSEPRDQNQSVTDFVQRLYSKVLGRSADVGGLNAHTNYLLNGGNAGTLSWSFFSAPEFSNKNMSNADKVEHVYLAMLDRPSDPAGKADWVGRLNGGESLYSIVSGFVRSNEFRNLCKKYGIYAGALTGDAELDSIIDNIISRYGTDLYALYNYVASYPYISGSKYPTGNWTPGFAKEMYWNGGGNCYRYAALFEQLARAAGYEAHAVAGHALNRYGGWNAHGWVEVYINGTTYVCDPQSTHAIAGRNFYMVTYDNAPLTYRTW